MASAPPAKAGANANNNISSNFLSEAPKGGLTTRNSSVALDPRHLSFSKNNESMEMLAVDGRIGSPRAPGGNVSRDVFSNNSGLANKVKNIKEQRNRASIRSLLRRNINTTFSKEAIEVPQEKKEFLARQYENRE